VTGSLDSEKFMAQDTTVPPLKVRQMGKKWRICYAETLNLARFNSGDPVDDGGFDEEIDAMIAMSKALGTEAQTDPEAERVE
jgi:hypothetical protein